MTVWQRLNQSASNGALQKYGLIACFVALVAWPSVTSNAFAIGLALIIVGKRTWKQRVGLLVLLVAGLTWAGIYYHLIPGLISRASIVPLVEYSAVDEQVYLGGDDIRLVYGDRIYQFTSCFYTQKGLLVAAGHEFKLPDNVGEPTVRVITDNHDTDSFIPEILEATLAGIVLGPIKNPDDRPLLTIAGPEDVSVGEKATLYSVKGGTFEVTVLGYYNARRGSHELLIQAVDPETELLKGMSGSPVVQNGKIIGLFVAKFGGHNGPAIGFARVAAEVYRHAVGSK